MRLVAYCVRRPLFAHGLRPPSSWARIGPPPPNIRCASSIAGDKKPTKRKRASFVFVFAAAFSSTVAYKQYQKSRSTDLLDPQTFTPFKLVSREPVSSTCSIFTFRAANAPYNKTAAEKLWNLGVWSVQVKQPQLQIARAYTPLPPSQIPPTEASEQAPGLRFLIRKEPKGEVSGYLHKLPNGANVELRGPNIEYALPEDVEEVVFLAGGTGIAPALQVAHSLLGLDLETETPTRKQPRLHILWACRRREDCLGGTSDTQRQHRTTQRPALSFNLASRGETTNKDNAIPPPAPQSPLVVELEALKTRHPNQLSVDYFVDEENTYIGINTIQRLVTLNPLQPPTHPPTTSAANNSQTQQAKGKLILVSGPAGFVDHCAGPKKWEASREGQGKLGGMLAGLDLRDWRVWKL
ncbi:mitochondrial peripheral inner membrane protein [Acarospora aff. strigata]|nr:mitochondrial peripheral inner membrane protein [Acarospora aff. strigata]